VSELIQNGLAHHQAGRLQEAEAIYQSILQEQPQHPDALHLLGVIAHQVGKNEIAVNLIENAIKINATAPSFYNNCGEAYRSLHKNDLAIARYKQALAITPDFAEAHNNMGNALEDLGQLNEAIACYEQALVIKPDYAEAHYNLGNTLEGLSRTEEAIACYEQALVIKPDFVEAHNNIAKLFNELGRLEEAIDHYQIVLTIKPDFAEVYRHLSLIRPSKDQARIIEEILKNSTVSEHDAMQYHYALGNIFNESKSYTKVFEHYFKANALKRKTIAYDSQHHSAFVDCLLETYSENYFQKKTTYGSDSKLPVFILGMPRSGTTLVEQIVSSHPLVYGAGELASFECIERTIAKQLSVSSPYPECMALCKNSIVQKISAKYLEEIRNYSKDAHHIIDKTPFNFLRIGLIKTLFPQARIIHCQRNALDTCTSIYFNYFNEGNSYSFDLIEIGQFYLDYERLMSHWRSLFPSEIFEIQYEELVMNQENVSRQLIDYLELEWNDRCMDFHKNKRAVMTASNLQVRQPMYNNSISRWKRYEKHLRPLIEILKHHI
jgi:tetratricopeptide (TPR) repeat protein